jgi:DNA helicase-2/ATP-dependent DNA helicase PcrA
MQMEEERRLCYVGITRAKEKLYLLYAFRRTQYGESEPNEPSRFLADIPRPLVKKKGDEKRNSLDEYISNLSFKKQTTWTPRQQPAAAIPTQAAQEFRAGDHVIHPTFGEGIVVSSKISGPEEELEVAFEGKGVKRLIASFAKLEKKKS